MSTQDAKRTSLRDAEVSDLSAPDSKAWEAEKRPDEPVSWF